MSELTVDITYLNKDLERKTQKSYTLKEYTEMIRLELMRVIMDVEDALYKATGDKSKDEWGEDVMSAFKRVRHKLLDEANAIERLPRNLRYNGKPCAMTMGDFLNDLGLSSGTRNIE